MPTVHRPVMAAECLREMSLVQGQIAVDGTAGGGGHTIRIARAVGETGRVIAIDRDPSMLVRAQETTAAEPKVELRLGSYKALRKILDDLDVAAVDAILVDLGLSSDQLADRDRGFGFQTGGPLDLRFDKSSGMPASEWLRSATDEAVRMALSDFADLSPNSPITNVIVAERHRLSTTEKLSELVLDAAGGRGKTHPVTVVLQALRIVVNDELSHVDSAIREVFPSCLAAGGRLVVLTFHSIEDRLVKRALQQKEVWTCRQKKPILPRPAEVRDNPRSRSAKLRAALRVRN